MRRGGHYIVYMLTNQHKKKIKYARMSRGLFLHIFECCLLKMLKKFRPFVAAISGWERNVGMHEVK